MTLTEYGNTPNARALCAEWSPQNGALTPDMVLTTSRAKVWWQCAACGHAWRDTVKNRVEGASCPACQHGKAARAVLAPRRKLRVDLTGRRFGRLVVLSHEGIRRESLWLCQCDCGNQAVVTHSRLARNITTSCGCKRAETQKANFENGIHFVEGTCIEKIAAKSTAKNNTSGFRGVSERKNGTFRVSITFKGKRYHLGNYPTLEQAAEARLAGEVMIDEFVAYFKNTTKL